MGSGQTSFTPKDVAFPPWQVFIERGLFC